MICIHVQSEKKKWIIIIRVLRVYRGSCTRSCCGGGVRFSRHAPLLQDVRAEVVQVRIVGDGHRVIRTRAAGPRGRGRGHYLQRGVRPERFAVPRSAVPGARHRVVHDRVTRDRRADRPVVVLDRGAGGPEHVADRHHAGVQHGAAKLPEHRQPHRERREPGAVAQVHASERRARQTLFQAHVHHVQPVLAVRGHHPQLVQTRQQRHHHLLVCIVYTREHHTHYRYIIIRERV